MLGRSSHTSTMGLENSRTVIRIVCTQQWCWGGTWEKRLEPSSVDLACSIEKLRKQAARQAKVRKTAHVAIECIFRKIALNQDALELRDPERYKDLNPGHWETQWKDKFKKLFPSRLKMH
jgi:hypothetical protein